MRQWQVRRTWQPHLDGQRRWDRTYQQLMAWTQTPPNRAADLQQELVVGSWLIGLSRNSTWQPVAVISSSKST